MKITHLQRVRLCEVDRRRHCYRAECISNLGSNVAQWQIRYTTLLVIELYATALNDACSGPHQLRMNTWNYFYQTVSLRPC